MIIRFGLDLDGFPAPGNYYNEIWAGPRSLLDVLETRLGLKGKCVCQAQRILQYRDLLQTAAKARDMFYSRSLEQDPFSTAEVLLGMRDKLVEAGWTGDAFNSTRLADLAVVERFASGRLAAGHADRLRRVVEALNTRSPQLDKLVCIERPVHLPYLWRVALGRLNAVHEPVDDSLHSRIAAPPESDLGKIQNALAKPTEKIRLRGDGSFQIVTAYSEATLAHGLPQYLTACRSAESSDCWLISDDCSNILDLTFEKSTEARIGFRPVTLARAIPQVLRLALRLHWSPLDPQHLLEFLTHPVCPVNGELRRKLAKAVSGCPGIGNKKWSDSIQELRQKIEQDSRLQPQQKRDRLNRIDSDLAKWLEIPRHNPRDGAPAKEFAQCCADLAAWAGANAALLEIGETGTAELYLGLAAASADLRECLERMSTVTHPQLERLLEDVCGGGWCCAGLFGEADRFPCLQSPGAIVRNAEKILWWNCIPGPQLTTRWTTEEIDELASNRVFLHDPGTKAAHENARSLRPVFAAQKELLLFCPQRSRNGSGRQHPIVNRIAALVHDQGRLPTIDIDKCITAGTPVAPITLKTFPTRALPRKKRWWKLSCPIPPRSRAESFSSAEKFIFRPYAWLLSYKAELKAGVLWDDQLMSGARQKGVILHRLVDLLFAPGASIDWRTVRKAEFEGWLHSAFETLIATEAANLLVFGQHSEQKALLHLAERALWELLTHFREAKILSARTAVKSARVPFTGGLIEGEMDVVVESAQQTAIVDLKFGRYEEKRDELSSNLHLQLAIYCYLYQSQEKSWPAAAYFILGRSRLMAQETTFFPGAVKVAPETTPFGTQVCWEEFESLWKWRREQLDKGWVELTVNPTDMVMDEAPASTPPIERWSAKKFDDATFRELTGWEAHQ